MEAEDPTRTPEPGGTATRRAASEPESVQETLPFAEDGPVPFALTARARRAVAPDSLPSLRVLPDASDRSRERSLHDAIPVDLDDPHDTRPSRARALRRAGVALDDIAAELGVDDLVVRAWVDEVEPVRSARRRLRAVVGPDAAHPAEERRTRQVVQRHAAAERFRQTRREARRDATDRLADPTFATGLGLLAGVLETGVHAAVVTVRRREVGGAVVGWLLARAEVDPQRIRVLLRLAPQAPADVAAHRWAEALGLAAGQVSYTRWRAAPAADAEEATIRIADPAASARLAGWRDALLDRVAGDEPAPTAPF